MSGLENGMLVTDVRARRNPQPSDLRCAGIGDVVAVEVRRRQNVILRWTNDHLLEDRISDPVIDPDLLFPCTFAVGSVNRIQALLDFTVKLFLEALRRKLKTRLDHCCVLFDGESGVLVNVIENPALALCDNVIAELIAGNLVSPLAESAFGKFLNVALVHKRD